MTVCSCGLWVSMNYVCCYYMTICFLARQFELAKMFAAAVHFSYGAAHMHLPITVGA